MLQQTIGAPGEAAVTDDLPTWRSEFNEWWEKRLKPFIDLRSFLHQRRLILRNPELAYCTEAPEKHWKQPFEFALSASLLMWGFCVLLGLFFHTVFPDPDTANDWISLSMVAQIDAKDAHLRAIGVGDEQHAVANDAQRDADEKSAKADLEDHQHQNSISFRHEELLPAIGIPLAIYLIGVLYPAIISRTRASSAPRAAAARRIVYYYFASRTFWPMFLFVITTAAIYLAERYSIFNEYQSVEPMFPMTSGPLFILMTVAMFVILITWCYAVIATPVALHKCAKRLPELIGVTDAGSRRILYWWLHVTVAMASILSLIIAFSALGGYGTLDWATGQLHQMTGAEFSTTLQ
jgi:hypothetical protein